MKLRHWLEALMIAALISATAFSTSSLAQDTTQDDGPIVRLWHPKPNYWRSVQFSVPVPNPISLVQISIKTEPVPYPKQAGTKKYTYFYYTSGAAKTLNELLIEFPVSKTLHSLKVGDEILKQVTLPWLDHMMFLSDRLDSSLDPDFPEFAILRIPFGDWETAEKCFIQNADPTTKLNPNDLLVEESRRYLGELQINLRADGKHEITVEPPCKPDL